jgi:hypothetical protein
MGGFSYGVLLLAFALTGSPREYAIHLPEEHKHIVHVIKMEGRASPWDRGKRRITIVETGHSERIVYQGPWEGDEDDYEGMVRETKRRDSMMTDPAEAGGRRKNRKKGE